MITSTPTGRPTHREPLKVDDRIEYRGAMGGFTATVVEDRGPLGVGGRQIVRIREDAHAGDPEQDYELPAELLSRLNATPMSDQPCPTDTPASNRSGSRSETS